jgi:hypothetical protein
MASKRSRVPQPRALKRKVATRQPRKTLVVFCEGEKTAVELRRQFDGSSDKSLDAAKYMPLIGDAVRHAALLDTRHQRDGSKFPHNNPSSGMPCLIASVRPPAD